MVMGGTEAGPDRVVYLKTNVCSFFLFEVRIENARGYMLASEYS